jgi:CRISPR/Cas system endoribonuclease Cas6 (RAMP superfamily)
VRNRDEAKGKIPLMVSGYFWLEGEPEFLQFALAAGLGSRNSGGFGFIEKVEERRM